MGISGIASIEQCDCCKRNFRTSESSFRRGFHHAFIELYQRLGPKLPESDRRFLNQWEENIESWRHADHRGLKETPPGGNK